MYWVLQLKVKNLWKMLGATTNDSIIEASYGSPNGPHLTNPCYISFENNYNEARVWESLFHLMKSTLVTVFKSSEFSKSIPISGSWYYLPVNAYSSIKSLYASEIY